jgi:Domain of unknown function (DUF4116)
MAKIRPRLERILDLYGYALCDAVGQRESSDLAFVQRPEVKTTTSSEVAEREAQLSAQTLIHRFADMDPTDGKSRTQWMIQTYIKDEHFKLEDLGRAHAALSAFERFKPKLQREQRELSRLTSLRGLETLVDPFVKAETKARLTRDLSTATGREKRRLEEWKARDESIIIQEAEGLPTIAVPMTVFASQWWGRGTKWCTAADENNAFANYQTGPLVILVCPATCRDKSRSEKFQVHICPYSLSIQFMDATANEVTEKITQERWTEFQPLVSWMLKQNGQALSYVPKKLRTPELCYLAVEQNGRALLYVPEEYKTHKLCLLAVQFSKCTFNHVDENIRSHTVDVHACKKAVILEYVPEEYKTPEFYRFSVEQNGVTLYHVPEELRTPELCYLAVVQNGIALCSVPNKYKTPELYRLAIEKSGQALEYIPKDKRTLELCEIAVERDGLALKHMPETVSFSKPCYKTLEIYRLAVEQHGCALKYVPDEHRTPELCSLAVLKDGWTLVYVPERHRTPELCRLAVEQDGGALCDVPEEYRTPEFLARVAPVKSKWHPDILQGLCPHS